MIHRLCKPLSAAAQSEQGQGLTEYALIIAFVAIALAATLAAFAGGLVGLLNTAVAAL